MKTQTRLIQFKKILLLLIFGMAIQFSNAQESPEPSTKNSLVIKGQVTDSEGFLPGTSIYLKGSSIGVVSDDSGNYTFPKPLAVGDILVFSYLGYEKKEVKVTSDTLVINPKMELESTEIVLTALDKGLPFKSKRK